MVESYPNGQNHGESGDSTPFIIVLDIGQPCGCSQINNLVGEPHFSGLLNELHDALKNLAEATTWRDNDTGMPCASVKELFS